MCHTSSTTRPDRAIEGVEQPAHGTTVVPDLRVDIRGRTRKEPATGMRRFPLVDGLRGLAACLVLFTHLGFWTGADALDVSGGLLARGDSGVAVFFAISAFLLLTPWIRSAAGADPAAANRPSVRRYAVHRAARILPAYYVALAAVLVVAACFSATGGIGDGSDVLRHLLLLQGYDSQRYQAFSQTWSLTTEVTFYVFVPVLGRALGVLSRAGTRRAYAALACLALLSLAIQGWAASGGSAPHSSVLATSVIGHAGWFCVGAALTVALVHGDLDRARLPSPGVLLGAAAVVYLLASSGLAGPRGLQPPSAAQAMSKEVLYAVIAGLLLTAATHPGGDERWARLAVNPVNRWLGRISYGVFLWQVLVLQVIYLLLDRAPLSGPFGSVAFATVVFSCLLGAASAQLIERPAIRWAHRRTARSPQPARTG